MAAPACIVIATGEDDLDGALSGVPPALRDRVVLLQNELRPHLWKDAGIEEPSVTIVWFERKAGKPPHVVLPSFTWGPMAPLLESVYAALGLEFRRISRVAELAHELASKNLYILGLNLTGLVHPGPAGALLGEHRSRFDALVGELIELEQALLRSTPGFDEITLNPERLISDLAAAIQADPEHGSAGRSAPRRLERTLAHARRLNLRLPHLEELEQFS